jgi:hypothetical protein
MHLTSKSTTLASLLLLAVSVTVPGRTAVAEESVDLFAADLGNAFSAGAWSFDDGVLVGRDHHTLWTRKAYGDFVLDLEFKVAPGANSGIFLRSGDVTDDLAAIEIQVHESSDGTRYGMVGAIYDALPPSRDVARPAGEWNHFTITCQGPRVSVRFNGELVIDADLDRWSEAHRNPDGTPNKFAVALRDYARRGPIGLQGLHGAAGAPVWFRNLRIRELD